MQPERLTAAVNGSVPRFTTVPRFATARRVGAGFIWWATGVVCSVFLGAQLLPSLSVLSQLPFREVSDDLQTLFAYFTTHPTAGNLLQSLILTCLLGRLVLSVPLMWFIANLGSATLAWPRLLLRVVRRLPAVLGLFFIGHLALMVVLGVSAPYLLGRIAVASSSFDFSVVGVMLLAVVALASGGLALYDVSRIAALHANGGRPVLSTALLDGLTILTRRPRRVLGYTAGTWAGSLVVSLGFATAAFCCVGHAPESWGQLGAWLLMQLSVTSGLLVRAVGWSKLIAMVAHDRKVAPQIASKMHEGATEELT